MSPITAYRATPALVLRTRHLGEADLVVTVLLGDGSRAALVARGARRSRRRFAGCLQPGCELRIDFRLRPGQRLGRLQEATLVEQHQQLRVDLQRFYQACYLLELCEKFSVEGDANPELSELAGKVLRLLDQRRLSALELCYLDLRLLQVAGLNPDFSVCQACGRSDSSGWQPEAGAAGLLCADCAPARAGQPVLGSREVELLRLLGRRHLPAQPPAGMNLRSVSRLLGNLIESQAGCRLRSRRFLDEDLARAYLAENEGKQP